MRCLHCVFLIFFVTCFKHRSYTVTKIGIQLPKHILLAFSSSANVHQSLAQASHLSSLPSFTTRVSQICQYIQPVRQAFKLFSFTCLRSCGNTLLFPSHTLKICSVGLVAAQPSTLSGTSYSITELSTIRTLKEIP